MDDLKNLRLTEGEAIKLLERKFSIGYLQDGKPRTESDIALKMAIDALKKQASDDLK